MRAQPYRSSSSRCSSVLSLFPPWPSLSLRRSRRAAVGRSGFAGDWTSQGELGVPFERPKSSARARAERRGVREGRRAAQRRARSRQRRVRSRDGRSRNAGAVGSATSPPPHWLERGNPSRRTSMVIDPPDGRVPGDHRRRARPEIQRQGAAASATAHSTVRLTSLSTIAASRAACRARCSRRSTTRTRASCRVRLRRDYLRDDPRNAHHRWPRSHRVEHPSVPW